MSTLVYAHVHTSMHMCMHTHIPKQGRHIWHLFGEYFTGKSTGLAEQTKRASPTALTIFLLKLRYHSSTNHYSMSMILVSLQSTILSPGCASKWINWETYRFTTLSRHYKYSSSKQETGKNLQLNPFLPSLATAVLACWPEAVVRQLQKTDCFNPKGYLLFAL